MFMRQSLRRARRRQGGGNTAPSAPTIGVASAGNGTMSVTFSAPVSNGGSAITGYTATLSTGETQSGVSSPLNFTGLTNGIARTATVTATNAIGTSSPSDASNSVTPTASTQPLRFATTQNKIANSTDTGSTRPNFGHRWQHVIGSGSRSNLVFSYSNWVGSASSNLVVNTGNAVTITGMSAEYNGIVVPVTFGGLRTVTLADGANDIQSDPILPSAFSVSQFNVGDIVWTKTLGTIPTGASKVPSSPRQTVDISGSSCFFYDSAATTVSSVDVAGAFTSTGTALYSRSNGFCPLVLGRFVTGDPAVWFANGDSITAGTGDGSGYKYGRGWFQRAMVDADGTSNLRASANFAVHGSAATLANSDARIKSFYQYANRGLVMYGTNDFGNTGTGLSVAAMNSRIQTILSNMRSAGFTKVGVAQLAPRADSTDAWVTEVNQTTLSGWTSGGSPDTYNSGIGTLGADFLIGTNSVRGTDTYKWIVNGTANYAAFDNTHPSTGGANLIATENRAVIATNS